VLELGPLNATIHQVNECVAVADLEQLAEIHVRIMAALLRNPHAHSSPGHAQ